MFTELALSWQPLQLPGRTAGTASQGMPLLLMTSQPNATCRLGNTTHKVFMAGLCCLGRRGFRLASVVCKLLGAPALRSALHTGAPVQAAPLALPCGGHQHSCPAQCEQPALSSHTRARFVVVLSHCHIKPTQRMVCSRQEFPAGLALRGSHCGVLHLHLACRYAQQTWAPPRVKALVGGYTARTR